MRIDVLGVGFDNMTLAEAVEAGVRLMEEPGAHYVATPNPEIVEVCRENPEANRAVNGADLVLPDGIGVVKGAAMLGTPLKGRTPGIEFAAGLMARMAERGKALYLLGAKPGVAERAAERLLEQYPGLRIAGTHDGYFQEDGPVIEAIQKSRQRRNRSSGWSGTAPPPGHACCAALGGAWMSLPGPWSGRPGSGATMDWSGFTACARSPGGLDA